MSSYNLFQDFAWKKGVYTDKMNTDKSQSHRCFPYSCLLDFPSIPFFKNSDSFLSLLRRKCLLYFIFADLGQLLGDETQKEANDAGHHAEHRPYTDAATGQDNRQTPADARQHK